MAKTTLEAIDMIATFLFGSSKNCYQVARYAHAGCFQNLLASRILSARNYASEGYPERFSGTYQAPIDHCR